MAEFRDHQNEEPELTSKGLYCCYASRTLNGLRSHTVKVHPELNVTVSRVFETAALLQAQTEIGNEAQLFCQHQAPLLVAAYSGNESCGDSTAAESEPRSIHQKTLNKLLKRKIKRAMWRLSSEEVENLKTQSATLFRANTG
jgi:hypothetical protein